MKCSEKADLANSQRNADKSLQVERLPLSTIKHGSRQASVACEGLTAALESYDPSCASTFGQSEPRHCFDTHALLNPQGNEVSRATLQHWNGDSAFVNNCRGNSVPCVSDLLMLCTFIAGH